jgi:hypothetical protein
MTEQSVSPASEEFTWMTFMGQGAMQWGHSDLLAVGSDKELARLGELASYFSIRGDDSGGRLADQIWIVFPPMTAKEQANALRQLRAGVDTTLAKISKGAATAEQRDDAFSFLSPHFMESYDGDALVRALSAAPAKTAIIVGEAGRYRMVTTHMPNGSRLEETVRAAHLHQLLTEIDTLCRANTIYVTLDSGILPPQRQEALDLLMSVGDAGFVSGAMVGAEPLDADEVTAKVSRWSDAVDEGSIGGVIQDIEGDDRLSDRQRFYLKLEFLSQAGLSDPFRDLLKSNPDMLVELSVQQALAIARLSETADIDDFVEALVTQALPDIRDREDFAQALDTALRLRGQRLRSAVLEAFRSLHPNAPMLQRHDVIAAAHEGDFDRAATILALISDGDHDEETRFYRLLADGTRVDGWNPYTVHAAIAGELPDFVSDAGVKIALQLERAGRVDDSFRFLFGRSANISSQELLLLIRLASTALQAETLSSTDPIIEQIMDRSIAFLAASPSNGRVRTQLAKLLGPTETGTRGTAMLVTALMKRSVAMPPIDPRPKIADRPPVIPADQTRAPLECIWKWLAEKGQGMWLVGQQSLPAELLDVSADALIASILMQADYAGNRIAEASDLELLNMYLAAASAIAPLAKQPDEDLNIARTVGSKLAVAGKGQAARDIAEFIVTNSGHRPERHRIALFSFADIYARVGMRIEAMVAMAAALETRGMATWDEIWFETNLLFRLLRDAGMADLAIPLLYRSQEALDQLGIKDRDGFRLETMALQAKTSVFSRDGGSDDDLIELFDAAAANAAEVMDRSDDMLPIAMVLNTLVHLGNTRVPEQVASAEALLQKIVIALPPERRPMIKAAGRVPTLADIVDVARGLDNARYAVDAGYDLRHLRIMTRTLVGNALADVDPQALTYAVEASADRAIELRAANGTPFEVERLLTRADAPYESAIELSRSGTAIIGMALFDSHLATVEFENGDISEITIEPEGTFSVEALDRWSERFPKDYSLDSVSEAEMRDSVAALGVTDLPKRSIIVADARLQRLPTNLLTIDGASAGFSRAIGVTPSLEWLTASRQLDRKGNGAARMWIPVPPAGEEPGPLAMMADEVAPILANRGVELERGKQPSPEFADADVAIIGAHGGLTEMNRYFRSLSDDSNTVTGIAQIAEVTRKARLTILFVCSGGRIDPHPETGMAIGLAKQILARGSAAVIGPAWPIPFFVARPWLEAFLKAWQRGMMVLDACHAANRYVSDTTSWDPKRSLAMSLYGDPFIRMDA